MMTGEGRDQNNKALSARSTHRTHVKLLQFHHNHAPTDRDWGENAPMRYHSLAIVRCATDQFQSDTQRLTMPHVCLNAVIHKLAA